MLKCKADILSFQEAVEHMVAWVDGDEIEDPFDIKTNNISIFLR